MPAALSPRPKFSSLPYEVRRNLITQKSENSSTVQQNTQKFQFAAQIELFQENIVFDYYPLL